MTTTPKWSQNRQGKSWLNKAMAEAAADFKERNDIGGHKGDVLIMDDPLCPSGAPITPERRAALTKWLDDVIAKRIKKDGPFFCISSHLYEQDELDGELDYSWLTNQNVYHYAYYGVRNENGGEVISAYGPNG